MRQGRLIDDEDDATTAVGGRGAGRGSGEEAPESTEGLVLDYITNRYVPDSPREQVRQRVARALFREYGLPRRHGAGLPDSGGGQRRTDQA
jgi:hypothetical protein